MQRSLCCWKDFFGVYLFSFIVECFTFTIKCESALIFIPQHLIHLHTFESLMNLFHLHEFVVLKSMIFLLSALWCLLFRSNTV